MRSTLPPSAVLGPRPGFLGIVFLMVAVVMGWLTYMCFANLTGVARWMMSLPLAGVTIFCAFNAGMAFLEEYFDGYLWRIR